MMEYALDGSQAIRFLRMDRRGLEAGLVAWGPGGMDKPWSRWKGEGISRFISVSVSLSLSFFFFFFLLALGWGLGLEKGGNGIKYKMDKIEDENGKCKQKFCVSLQGAMLMSILGIHHGATG